MNEHDTERMLGILHLRGFIEVEDPKKADLIIFNTCAIREKAEQKFMSNLGRIKHLKKRKPDLKIIVAGCSAQLQGERLINKVPYVDFVIGPDNINILENIIENNVSKKIFIEENPKLATINFPAQRKDSVKAWVNITYGCNNHCAYCVVPYTRGKERSRPHKKIYNEIKMLAEIGYKEITLLGQNVNSYRDEQIDFPVLLEKISEIDGIERIRFITSHPKDLSERLVKIMKNSSKICEHIHLPLQAASDRILSLMNRKYTYNQYCEKIQILRDYMPNIAITSDIIVGFPQETDEDFEKTIYALMEIQFDGIFAFKFSPRPRTPASKLDGKIDEKVKSDRLTKVLKLQDIITERKNKNLEGAIQEVLIEGEDDNGLIIGRTKTNKIVKINSNLKPGEIIKVQITRANRHSLEGNLVTG